MSQNLGFILKKIWFVSKNFFVRVHAVSTVTAIKCQPQLPSCTSMLIKSHDCLEQSNPDEVESELW